MKIRSALAAFGLALATLALVAAPTVADAKRLGGGKPAGMQRQMPAKPADANPGTPAQPANPAATPNQAAPMAGAAAPAAAAAAGKRSWLGPIAGIAAGLGLAALFSHFGMGEAFGNFMTMALLAIAAVFLIRFLMRRFAGAGAGRPAGGLQFAGAGAPAGGFGQREPALGPMAVPQAPPMAQPMPMPVAASAAAPEGFDAEAFERVAKQIFVRLQAANDAGAVDDLRKFTTPELFASLRVDLQERGGVAQQTDVVQLAAQVVAPERDGDHWLVSVRFHGLIREAAEAGAHPFDETWHLVKPVDGSREWAIAGISPTA